MPVQERLDRRYLRFRRIGEYDEAVEYVSMNGNG